jgi:hypothetical protein
MYTNTCRYCHKEYTSPMQGGTLCRECFDNIQALKHDVYTADLYNHKQLMDDTRASLIALVGEAQAELIIQDVIDTKEF